MRSLAARYFILCSSMCLCLGALSGSATAQTPGPAASAVPAGSPAFEVATIKPIDPKTGGIVGFVSRPGGRVFVGFATVKMLIYYALNVQDFQIAGGPDWVGTEKWNIEAVPPDSSQSRTAKVPSVGATPSEEQRQMLLSLLVERFGLKFHRETREGPVYYLTTNGKKLAMNPPKDPHADPRRNMDSTGWAFGTNVSMAGLAEEMSYSLNRPVIDQTGLKGSYDFQLERDDPENKNIVSGALDISKRLGLDLKLGKGPVETIVIDSVSKPTEN